MPDLDSQCADLDAEIGMPRPAGWETASHCKLTPAATNIVIPADKVTTLAITMTAADYAAMQADLDELMGGGDDFPGSDPFEACAGLELRDPCEIDIGNGPEPGSGVDLDGAPACFPDWWRAPPEWGAACVSLGEGDACMTATHDSICQFDGVDLVCFPLGPEPGGGEDPCAGKAGYEDIQAFLAALHSSRTDRMAWRSGLAARFDIDGFVDFYAINQAISNWDRYGGYAHNYCLYADSATGLLRFMPWDFDLAFDASGPNDLTMRSFDGTWPLLQTVARDVELATRYQAALAAFAEDELGSGKLAARIDTLANLIRPAIEREDEAQPGVAKRFASARGHLHAHVDYQSTAIQELLRSQEAPLRARAGRGAVLPGYARSQRAYGRQAALAARAEATRCDPGAVTQGSRTPVFVLPRSGMCTPALVSGTGCYSRYCMRT